MAPFLITVFGAGGKTGQECVKAALARGDSVRAVVREQSLAKYEQAFAALSPASAASSSSSSSSSSKLEVVAGDVEASPDDLEKLLSGASAAIFAASASKTGDVWKVDRDGLANLATAAAKAAAGSVRVVAVSSALVSPHNGWHPIRLLLNNMRGGGQKIMDAKFAGEELLRKSGADFTVVRPGGLQDAPPLGASALVVSQGDKSGAGRISRTDVAELCVAAAHAGAEASRVTLEVSSDPKREKKETSYESLFTGLAKDPPAAV